VAFREPQILVVEVGVLVELEPATVEILLALLADQV
jgi:hypothetical protein